MTATEAINTINSLKQYYNDKNEDSYVGFDNEDNEALEMSINALKQKSYKSEARRWKRRYLDLKQRIFKLKEQQPCEDCVSREEVMKLLGKEDWADTVYGVMNLPSVKLPRPKSKWNYINEHARRYRVCSNCGYTKEDDKFYGWYFCPNCGAEMEIKNEKETC